MLESKKLLAGVFFLPVFALLAGCAVGPGTPLSDVLSSDFRSVTPNVPSPKHKTTQSFAIESHGLINPDERQATQEYLDSLVDQ